MKRDDPWPESLQASQAIADRAKRKFDPILAKVHSLELLGLAQALQDEIGRRPELAPEVPPVGISNRG